MNGRSNTPSENFAVFVGNHPRESVKDACDFILLASRLAAMEGDKAGLFRTWPELAGKNKEGITECMSKEIRNGLNTALLGSGLTLAHSVLEAQAYACFLQLSREQELSKPLDKLLDRKIITRIEEWIFFAGKAHLDAMAARYVSVWRRVFPVRETFLLPNVLDPEGVSSRNGDPEAYWPVIRRGISGIRGLKNFFSASNPDEEADRYAAASNAPSQNLKDAVSIEGMTVDCGELGTLLVGRSLNEEWWYSITVSLADEAAFPLESVMFGLYPAVKFSDYIWHANLSDLDNEMRWKVLVADIRLIPWGGTKRLCLQSVENLRLL